MIATLHKYPKANSSETPDLPFQHIQNFVLQPTGKKAQTTAILIVASCIPQHFVAHSEKQQVHWILASWVRFQKSSIGVVVCFSVHTSLQFWLLSIFSWFAKGLLCTQGPYLLPEHLSHYIWWVPAPTYGHHKRVHNIGSCPPSFFCAWKPGHPACTHDGEEGE